MVIPGFGRGRAARLRTDAGGVYAPTDPEASADGDAAAAA
jgi:hypothetical protein